MKILVDTARRRLNVRIQSSRLVRRGHEGVKLSANPFDDIALE